MKNTFIPTEFLGRLLFVALFLPAGVSKLFGFEGTVGYFGSLGIPMASSAVVATIAIEVLGSVALLTGYKTRYAALTLAAFTLIASLLGHGRFLPSRLLGSNCCSLKISQSLAGFWCWHRQVLAGGALIVERPKGRKP
jgi:uncharacterized membrane protein YphA (DoxX/SURF4 family)